MIQSWYLLQTSWKCVTFLLSKYSCKYLYGLFNKYIDETGSFWWNLGNLLKVADNYKMSKKIN